MARPKSYLSEASRTAQLTEHCPSQPRLAPIDPNGACIDMELLLGPETRFTSTIRKIDLSDWLARGIDEWVWASIASLKAMLLSGSLSTATVTSNASRLLHFFAFLTEAGSQGNAFRPKTPLQLSPLHIRAFIAWLQKRAEARSWTATTTRNAFKNVQPVILEMLRQGYVVGDQSRLFMRSPLPLGTEPSRQTSLSDNEQERLARAIKTDLVAVHHGRLSLRASELQALRLLLIAHRQGANTTALLELRRDALLPGLLPGTVRIRTIKHRNRTVRSSIGRAEQGELPTSLRSEEEVVFNLAEGAVLRQAIDSTRALADEAPPSLKSRVWLYRSSSSQSGREDGAVTALTQGTLNSAMSSLVSRHALICDTGGRLKLNISRLRKSFFDRAFRTSDGDLTVTANLMGNTPHVAGVYYPSMNEGRQSEASVFLNVDYVGLMSAGVDSPRRDTAPRVVKMAHVDVYPRGVQVAQPHHTPVSRCKDTLNGEHAPRDGHNHCERYIMCLFCSSFAVVGTIEDLWRLFSFQAFAKEELAHLEAMLRPQGTTDPDLEDLRDRYRVAIPFIDEFSLRQFSPSLVRHARVKTRIAIHPFWTHLMNMSERGRSKRQIENGGIDGSTQRHEAG